MTIEITVIDIVWFIILIFMFIGLECLVNWKITFGMVLKLLPVSIFFSTILILVWNLLQVQV